MATPDRPKTSRPGPAGAPRSIHEPLKAERIQLLLREHSDWQLLPGGRAIQRSVRVPNRSVAVAFSGLVAELAKAYEHEAQIDLRGDRVLVTLTTRSVRGLTAKDFSLADALELRG